MTDLTELLSSAAAIVGKIGTGKTYVAKGVVEKLLALGRRVVIIDPTGVWYGLRSGANGSEKGGFPVMIFGGDHADVPITDHGGEAVALAIAEREVQCIIDLSDMTNAAKIRFMTPFLEHLYAKNRAALHLIVDEADEIAAQRLADGEQRMFGAFDKIVRRGRVKGFRPLMITQRPAVLHKNVLSQVGTLIALQLTSPQDRKAIEEWVKGNADTDQAREVMSTLPTLQRGEGWVWSPSSDVLERTQFPAISTFDSSRTPEAGETIVAPALSVVDVEELRAAMAPSEAATTSSTTNAEAKIIAPSKAEIEEAEKRGYERGERNGYANGFADGWRSSMTYVRSAIGEIKMPTIPVSAGSPSGKATAFDAVTGGSNPPPATKARPAAKIAEGLQQVIAYVNGDDSGVHAIHTLSPSARKIIDAVKAAYPTGVSLVAAAKRAGLSSRSSAYRKHMQDAASSAEIVDRGDGRFVAASPPDGVAPPPGTSAFKSKLPPSYAKMLDVIEAAGGKPVGKAAIATHAGISPTSSGLGSGLRELVALELIVKEGDSYALSPDLL